MEKKNAGVNVMIIMLSSLVVALSGYIVYDKALSDKEIKEENNNSYLDSNTNKEQNIENTNTNVNYVDYTEERSGCTYKYSFETNTKYNSSVNVEDTYAITIRPDLGKNIFLLHDGKIYYNIDKCSTNNSNQALCNFTNYNLSSNNKNDSLIEFDKIENVKRIKSVNYGTGINYSIIAITNDGKVYLINNYNQQLNYNEIDEDFGKYNVDNIISYNVTVPCGDEWEVILKDGTKMKKTIETN